PGWPNRATGSVATAAVSHEDRCCARQGRRPKRDARRASRPRAPNSWMAYDLKGDLCEEVTDDPLFSRSPRADPRDGPARGGVLAPDRSSLPGQPVLRHPAVATRPPYGLPPTPTPSRRKPRCTRAGGLGAAPGVG